MGHLRKARYIKQQDDCSCGPVSMINVKKWLGYKSTYKDVKKIRKKIGMGKGLGVMPSRLIAYALLDKQLRPHFRGKMEPMTAKRLSHLLKKEVAVVLDHGWTIATKKGNGHYTLVIGEVSAGFAVVNHDAYEGPTVRVIRRDYIDRLLKVRWAGQVSAALIFAPVAQR